MGLLYEEDGASGQTKTYHYDRRGSTVAVSADDGRTVTDRWAYGAYGERLTRTGATDTPFQFNGFFGVQTDANGLLYMNARYYNPETRRFVSADPMGFAESANFYWFANGDPLSLADPFGLGAADTAAPLEGHGMHDASVDMFLDFYAIPKAIGGLVGKLAGAFAAKGSALSETLAAAKPTVGHPAQVMTTLDDGSRVLFRKDFGASAHSLNGPFKGAGNIDHYNIQLQSQTGKTLENLHIVPDGKGGYIWWGKDGVVKP